MGFGVWVGVRRVLLGITMAIAVVLPGRGSDRDAFEETLAASLESTNPEAASIFAEANTAREQQDWKRAEALYGQVRRIVPGFFHATRRQCGVVLAQGRRNEAIDLCRIAFRAAETPENLTAMAYVLVQEGQDSEPSPVEVAEGLELARRALRLAPEDPVILPSICMTAVAGDDVDLLREAAARLAERAPEELSTHYFAFVLAMTDGRFGDASAALERARERGLAPEAYEEMAEALRAASFPPVAGLEFSGALGKLFEALAWYLIFLLSVTFHEAAHAFVAKRGGDLTAYHGGQVSLSPWPHIRREPLGMVILPVISLFLAGWPFGFASTPYDPRWADRYPRRVAWMSLAGPAANLFLVLSAAAVIRLGMLFGLFTAPMSVNLTRVAVAPGFGAGAAYLLSILFSLNLILFVLNLIPLPPLDGSGALPLLLNEANARRVRGLLAQPMLAWFGLIVAWKLFDSLFPRIFLAAIHLLYPGSRFA